MIERHVRLESVYALVCLIDYQQIPVLFNCVSEFVKLAAEINGALEVLEAHEFQTLNARIAQTMPFQIPARCGVGPPFEIWHIADEHISGFRPHEFAVITVP